LGAEASPAPAPRQVKKALDAFVSGGTFPGYAAILITPSGNTTLTAGGLSTTEITGIASVTKVLTTLALADLVREGKLLVDAPVSSVIPEASALPRWENRRITLRDLATHTSALPAGQAESFTGLASWYSPRVWRIFFRRLVLRQNSGMLGGVTWDDIFAFLSRARLSRAPGTRFEYSNIGMGLLGHAVAVRAGTTYEEAVLARVCRPLGMNKTSLLLPPGTPQPRVQIDLGPLAGAGGLHSNAEDLAILVRAALGMGTPPALAEDFAITFKPQGKDADGRPLMLGWQVDGKSGRLYHAGLTNVFIGIDRRTKVGVVLIVGAGYQGIENLGLEILEALSGGRPDFPRPRLAVELPPAILSRYAGAWRLDGESWVKISVQGKALKALFMKGKKRGGIAVLWPENERWFFCRDWDCTAEFAPPSGAKPASVAFKMYSWTGIYLREH